MTRKEFAKKLRRQFRRVNGYINPLPDDAKERLKTAESGLGFAWPGVVRFVFKHAGEDSVNPEWSAEKYVAFCRDAEWPEKMVPLVEEGCGIWLCLDCSRKQAPVFRYRGDLWTKESPELVFEAETPTFVEWLRGQLPRADEGYAKDS